MKDFWNERFCGDEFVYGTAANEFLKNQLVGLPIGKILFPAEGEGRNAVFAASLGWQVFAYDFAEKGRKKANQLAKSQNINLNYDIFTHQEAVYPEAEFDAIALIYCHTTDRQFLHHKVWQWLKPGGKIILEGFSKDQLNYNSGGPKDLSMLFSIEEIEQDFSNSQQKFTRQETIVLNEGKHHCGQASVVRAVITKPHLNNYFSR